MISEKILSQIKSGAKIRVWERVKEGDKSRLSKFEGLVLARKHGAEQGATFTVRSTVASVGVEKIYPVHSPHIEKVEVLSSPRKVHRSKIYYIRGLSKKQIKRKTENTTEKTSA